MKRDPSIYEMRPLHTWKETSSYLKKDPYVYTKRFTCMKRDIFQNRSGSFSHARATTTDMEKRPSMYVKRVPCVYVKRPTNTERDVFRNQCHAHVTDMGKTPLCIWQANVYTYTMYMICAKRSLHICIWQNVQRVSLHICRDKRRDLYVYVYDNMCKEISTYVKRDPYMFTERPMCMKRDIFQNQEDKSRKQGYPPSRARATTTDVEKRPICIR